MGIVLLGPGAHTPDKVITNLHLEQIVDTSDEWIKTMTGISQRRISLDKNPKEMGLLAAQNLLKTVGLTQPIDEVIFATNRHSEEQEFPVHAGYVAAGLGIKKAIIHDKSAGCTGLVDAIQEAYNSINNPNGRVNQVLVVGSERLTDMTDYSDRNTCVLFGDGAGAYLVRRDETQEGIINSVLGGEPDTGDKKWLHGHLALEYKEGKKLVWSSSSEKFKTYRHTQNYLVMNGKEVYRFATRVMRDAVNDVLQGTNYSLGDVDRIIPHGANIRIIEAAEKGLKGFKGEIYTNLDRYGNTSTASVPIAAEEAIRLGIIKDGMLVINVAFGAGFTYGANLYRAIL